ncbi:MAG: DUF2231 domain-containing protein [Gemmatimonadaceae bacterium]
MPLRSLLGMARVLLDWLCDPKAAARVRIFPTREEQRLRLEQNHIGPDMPNASDATAGQQHAGRWPAIHPAVVHFPISLFPVSALFLILWFWRDSPFFLDATYWTFMFAALGAVIAGGTGILDYYNASYPEHPEEGATKISKLHVRTGVALTIIALVSAVYFLIEKPANDLALVKWFAIVVFLETMLVIIQGFLGGRLVYKYHFGVEPRHPQAT